MKKVKVCTITHHTVPNYGAVLQSFALQKKLDHLGIDNEILNYKSLRVERTYLRHLKYCKNVKQLIKYFLYFKMRKRYFKFDKFIIDNLNVSREYSKEELSCSNENYDLFITGSDQVWNLNIHQGDTSYMLDFVKDDYKKGSYAASFGYSEIPREFIGITFNLLKKLDYFLVREETGAKLLKDIGINKEINVVLDPTLLLTKEHYMKFVKEKREDYVLVYDLINSNELNKFALQIGKEKNLKVKCINTSRKSVNGMDNIYDAGPEEFLDLIANANYVVTSSYHGIIFSLVFEREFYFALNKNTTNNNSRIVDLSQKLGFENRNIECFRQTEKINYDWINQKLDNLRKNSESLLLNMIRAAEERGEKNYDY